MSNDLARQLLSDLARFRESADQLERQAAKERESADRQQRLVDDMQAQYPDWFAGSDLTPKLDSVPAATAAPTPNDQEAPRGQDAVLEVLRCSDNGKLSSVQIQEELTVRGWAAPNDPEGSSRAALRRLVAHGKVQKLDEKDGRAHVYAIPTGEKSEASDMSEASVGNHRSAVGAAGPDQ